MSAGPFSVGRYQRNDGTVHPVRCQPETVALTLGGDPNNFPAAAGEGTQKSDISAQISGSRRSLGLHTRLVRVKFGSTAGAAPDGYSLGGAINLPVFQKSLWDSISKGDSGNYLGKVVTITSKTDEVAV